MTGYQSKKAAAQDKLAQPEQEALKLALEVLKEIARHATTHWEDEWCGELANETLTAINALAQPVQEPWRESASDYERGVIDGRQMQAQSSVDKAVNAMTQRTWVGLTDEEISDIAINNSPMVHEFARAVQAKLKEKNT